MIAALQETGWVSWSFQGNASVLQNSQSEIIHLQNPKLDKRAHTNVAFVFLQGCWTHFFLPHQQKEEIFPAFASG